ncbi:MAG: DUF4292 domain-containing protein [Bacteroidales bacterium]|nr:DUF4292 domain-containing protein [Bacteroidales bacterium]
MIGISACKTGRRAMRSTEEKDLKSLVQDHCDADFKTLEGKLSVKLTNKEKEYSSRATLRIQKDSAIQLSIQPLLGIEAVRLVVTPDRVTCIDRFNQYYFQEETKSLSGDLQSVFNYAVLQSLLTNRLFLLKNTKLTSADFNAFSMEKKGTGETVLTEKKHASKVSSIFTFSRENDLSETFIGNKEQTSYVLWGYDEFETIEKSLFPTEMVIQAFFNNESAKLDLSFNSVNYDKTVNISDSFSKNYSKITVEQLIKLIQNLK